MSWAKIYPHVDKCILHSLVKRVLVLLESSNHAHPNRDAFNVRLRSSQPVRMNEILAHRLSGFPEMSLLGVSLPSSSPGN